VLVVLVVLAVVGAVAAIVHWRTTREEVATEVPPLFMNIVRPADVVSVRRELSVTLPRSDDRAPRDIEEPIDVPTVRFQRPTNEAVQLLPGRLEIVAGDVEQQDIRLVRVAGQRPELLVGREPGASPRQIKLQSPTVSRRHALFSYDDGGWIVASLSPTNPVVVNDQVLEPDEPARRLTDGDRVEIGEVVLYYHAS
jgi:hypothetical protein